jgi:tetratricopeptide (TPR) repeat protein
MGKDRILDPCYKALGLLVLATIISSCSIPKIIVLKDPLTPEEHINLGVSYENKGELDAALKEYETASKKLPIAYLYIGNVHFRKNDFKNAEFSYKKAIKKTQDPRAYNNLAWLYYIMNKNMEEAEALAKKAVELSPRSHDFEDTLNKIIERRK